MQVYQYKLVNHQNKYYLVVNILPDNKPELKPEDLQEVPEDVNKVLIFLVLTHIFMSENDVTEGLHKTASSLRTQGHINHFRMFDKFSGRVSHRL